MAGKKTGKQAVVIGAGMAGLAAAGAIADYFEQVTVLERDRLPDQAVPRAGAPQSRHLHALLPGGERALTDLFPHFERDLIDAGAVPHRMFRRAIFAWSPRPWVRFPCAISAGSSMAHPVP